jgi:tetratricopeptide (TPR) repeat protein
MGKMNKLIFIILIIFSLHKSNAQWAIMSGEADSLVLMGADLIYNCKFDSAHAVFVQVIKKYPDHPAGYFLDGMVDWWRITVHRNVDAYQDQFLKKMDLIIDKCDELLEENPSDLTALFFKGGALGYRGRFYARDKQWFSAAVDGKAGLDIMLECHKRAPGNHDIMLGSGIYNYFAGAIPEKYPMVKPLMYFLPDGDKRLGLFQLKASAKKARYTSVEARVALLQSYYNFEHDYRESLIWAKDLHEDYPANPYFHRYLARCYNRLGRWNEIESHWREIVTRSIKRWEGYNNKTASEGLYYVGLALQRKRKYAGAMKYFKKCIELYEYMGEDESSFYLSAQLKLGLTYDKMGKRELAKKQYNIVLDLDDYNGNHHRAEKYLEKAYK